MEIRPLRPSDERSRFSADDPEIDRFFRTFAGQNQFEKYVGTTYVAVEGAHILGFVGIDSKGLNGLESAYDSMIRGKDGQVLVQTDARRHAFSRFEKPPTAGATIELTIDEFLQHVAERELRKIPFFVRGKAKRNTEKYADDMGLAAITLDTLYEAKAHYAR